MPTDEPVGSRLYDADETETEDEAVMPQQQQQHRAGGYAMDTEDTNIVRGLTQVEQDGETTGPPPVGNVFDSTSLEQVVCRQVAGEEAASRRWEPDRRRVEEYRW